MLDRQWKPIADQQILSGREVNREFIGLADVTGFLRRYALLIIACLTVGLLAAAFYVATTDPTYTARTQILIEPKIPQILQQQAAAEVNLSLDTAQVESQIAVMHSQKIATMVIKALNLQDDLTFNQSRSPTLPQRLRKLEALAISSFALDETPWYGALRNRIERYVELDGEAPRAELPEFEARQRTMAIFTDGLDIRRVGVSYAIDISFSSRDAQMAADIANGLASAYVREQLENKASAAREGGLWLETRMKELRTQMNSATQTAQEFRAKHDYRIGSQLGPNDANLRIEQDIGGPTLEELEVTADTYRKMYESFLAAYTNSVSRQSYPVADARVITEAARPLYPSQPRSKLVLAFGVLGGGIIGLGLAFLRLTQDRTLRSPRQLQESLGLECVGELPPVSKQRGFGRPDEVARSPRSNYADSLRRVMTAISLADVTQPIRTVGVTSALPGEGKSTCASNLAILYTRAGLRTLVIDTDITHATLSARLLPPRTGLVEVEGGEETVSRSIRPATTGGFDILPSADVEASRLLAPKCLQALLADLPGYDMIIVDLPPLSSGAEKLAISATLDGVVLVVEWGKTPLDLVLELSRSLQANKAPIIGVLMTKVRALSPRRYTRLNSRRAY
jgi:uncharacterized protein involved in exopolysaccharide biosynthesis/Mrp family chromosome partitioning ATPase